MNLDELVKVLDIKFETIDSEKVKEKILIYKNFLQSENSKYNLTRLDKEPIIYREYFYDSIINFESSLFSKKGMNVLDIGSGSGIPGIVLKILFDHINLYIVESNSKKCEFMERLKHKLNLKNTFIINKRCEDYIKSKNNFFDLITCRAVAELRILLELAIPGLKINGIGYFLKSNKYLEELNNSKNIIEKLKLDNPEINIIDDNNKTFVALKFLKKVNNDPIFPRSWKEILTNDKN